MTLLADGWHNQTDGQSVKGNERMYSTIPPIPLSHSGLATAQARFCGVRFRQAVVRAGDFAIPEQR